MGINELQIASELFKCRDAAQGLLGDRYMGTMSKLADDIRDIAKLKHCSELAAASLLAQEAHDGFLTIMLLAAFVEMTEPSVSTHDALH